MKVIRVHALGGPEVMHLEDIPDPTPAVGEVVVRMEAIGVNVLEVFQRNGEVPTQPPFTPGTEGAGTVVAVGRAVSGLGVVSNVPGPRQGRRLGVKARCVVQLERRLGAVGDRHR